MPSDHRRHDRLLIARYAADDSYPSETEEARAQIAACAECAALVDDIKILSRVVATARTPSRPRDFRLSPEQADQLRGTWFERLMRRFAAPGIGALRPVAGVALSIGLVMAVAGSLPSFAPAAPAADNDLYVSSTAMPAAAPEVTDRAAPEVTDGVAAPAVTDGPAAPAESVDQPPYDAGSANGEEPGPVTAAASQEAARDDEPNNAGFEQVYLNTPGPDSQRSAQQIEASSGLTSNLLTYAGLLIALASLGVLLVAWLARRRFSDPLLR